MKNEGIKNWFTEAVCLNFNTNEVLKSGGKDE
jgi:hypothetical protein